MRGTLIGLLAVAGIAVAAPASAQGIYFGAPGVGFGLDLGGSRQHYIDNDAPRYRNYGYDHPRYQAYGYRDDCRTVVIRRDDGSVRRIRRCD